MKWTTNGVFKDFLKKMSGPQLTANWNSCGRCAACCHVKQSVRWPAIWARNGTKSVFRHWSNKV